MAALRGQPRGEESPGSTETRCRVTPGGGDPRESATETHRLPASRKAGRAARVKWCGKSAPRRRQRRRQGKPHREQDQVGMAGRKAGGVSAPPSGSVARGARQRASQRNGHPSSRDGDRTRLIGRLALFFAAPSPRVPLTENPVFTTYSRSDLDSTIGVRRQMAAALIPSIPMFYYEIPLTPIQSHAIP